MSNHERKFTNTEIFWIPKALAASLERLQRIAKKLLSIALNGVNRPAFTPLKSYNRQKLQSQADFSVAVQLFQGIVLCGTSYTESSYLVSA